MSLLIFTFYYFILSFSVIGYGYIASKALKIKLDKNQMPLMGIIGLIFLTFISYVTNIFTPHNFIHNLFFLFIGLSLFLRLVFKDSQNKFGGVKNPEVQIKDTEIKAMLFPMF